MGAYVSLIEYNNIEGMILLSELSRRRIRSVNKLIRVGRQEIVLVLRVDKEKGYIDLSKRRVSADDVARFEDKYVKSKDVNSIMRHVAEVTEQPLEDLNNKITWPLYKAFGHAWDAFKLVMSQDGDPTIIEKYGLNEAELNALKVNIARRFTPQVIRFRADVEVSCFEYEGINAIKRALLAGKAAVTRDGEEVVSIKLISPPLFVLTAQSFDKEQGIVDLNKCIEVIKESILSEKGTMVVKQEARAVTDVDDKDLDRILKELEMAAQQEGEDDSDEETMGMA
eukprot:TRINITY_DN130_c0_g1_i1.p1 TRINITY_DN130_c0_g1~~TRINITY_DN130_c0_g1_i1.p1  ORF type:complete len:311 (+),score=107.61 TRINITY_DN130_c0_g1_i1:88-933(+)